MYRTLPLIVGVAAVGLATTVVAGAPASAGPGLAQKASATLALPAVHSVELLTRCVNGQCTTVSSPPTTAANLALDIDYTLLNASSLPDVVSYTGKPLVTTDGCNGRLGVAVTIAGTNIGTSRGVAKVNGQVVDTDTVQHNENGHSESLCLPV